MSRVKITRGDIDNIFASSRGQDDDSDSEQEEEEEDEEYIKPQPKKKKAPLVRIEKLSKKHLVVPDRILYLGACESGKTSLISQTIKLYERHLNLVGIWWFGANSKNERLPKCRARLQIDQDYIDKIRKLMKNIVREDVEMELPLMKQRYCIIVWDDVLGESFHQDRWVDDLISTCRHDNIILLVGLQYINKLPPVFRQNVKRAFIT